MATINNQSMYLNLKLENQIDEFPIHKSYLVITLAGQQSTDQDIGIIAERAILKRQCTYLDLRNNKITAYGASLLASTLKNNTTLETLYLQENSISDMGVQSLVQALSSSNNTLQILGLDSNGITDAGSIDLAKMLTKNQSLTHLTLRANKIADQGLQALAKVLMYENKTLQQLYLHENKMIGDSSLDSLMNMLKHNRILKVLDLRWCNFSDSAKAKLREISKSIDGFQFFID